MSSSKFRLGGVLRLRRLEEDVARAKAGEAKREAAEADLAAARRLAELRQAESTNPGVVDSRAFMTMSAERQRQATAVRAAWAAASAAHSVHAQRMAALVGASMRVAALEKLEERVAEENQEQQRQAEMRELDDLVTGRHGKKDL